MMKLCSKQKWVRVGLIAAASVGAGSLGACSQAPYQQAMTTSSHASMAASRASAVSSQAKSLVASLKQLAGATGDLQKPYADFTKSLESFKSGFSSLKSDLSAMLSDQKGYLATWNKENNTIQDASVKKVAMSRYDAAANDYASVKKAADGATTSGDSFVTFMDDLNTYLSTDLNAGGIASGAPLISKAQAKASSLEAKLVQLKASVKKVASDFAASGKGSAVQTAPTAGKKSSWWW